jgi:hypothetical protein
MAGENQYTVSVSRVGIMAHVVRSPLPRKQPVKYTRFTSLCSRITSTPRARACSRSRRDCP